MLLVAEILSGDSRQIAMLPFASTVSSQSRPRVTMSTTALWRQPEPVLDVLEQDSGSRMLVLSPGSVTSYGLTGNRWTQTSTASLVLDRPMPRDPRGRLVPTVEGFQIFLPVASCIGSWNPEIKIECNAGTSVWPGTPGTHWLADRNVLVGEASASSLPGSAAPGSTYDGWGSDWASIADPCNAGTLTVASSPNNDHDSIRAYVIRDGQASPVSDPLPVPGPVTALWPGAPGREATVVIHNLQTGEYEASRLGLACAQ